MAVAKPSANKRVEALKHNDTRVNIPTEELRSFVAPDEAQPKNILYPRDPSLDPQLVWKGKDEQDSRPLAVDAVPIYIQEKIQPRAIIEEVRSQARSAQPAVQPSLFGDFNGIEFEQLVEFYQHEQHWTNRMILGDSLLVMTSLAEKEGLKGKVQMIYVDPPYGMGFRSNWQVSTRHMEVKDRAEDATRQPEQVRAFRDTWRLEVHSYLAYLRDRLTVAQQLLTQMGSIFVQIGEENVHLVRSVLDEVFGRENFVSLIPFRKKTMPFGTNFVEQMADFILWYAKQKYDTSGKPFAKYRPLTRPAVVEGEFHHCWFELVDGSRHRMTQRQIDNHKLLPDGARVYRLKSLEPSGPMQSGMFTYEFQGRSYPHPKNGYGTTPEGMRKLEILRRLQPEGNRLTYIMYADENPAAALTVPWFDTVGADDKSYVVQTNTEVVKRCLLMTTDPGDLALDPTCGSGTTAYVAEQWGRRWITIDTSRVALTLARARLMSARFPYFLLADSPEGQSKQREIAGNRSTIETVTSNNLKMGFVCKSVSSVTLKSLANNPNVTKNTPPTELKALVAKNAEKEILYDQPYEDPRRVRVSGPFTVEGLSPHRVPTTDQDLPASERNGQRDTDKSDFTTVIIDNLKKAGVQNTKKAERLKFDILEPFAGRWIQAAGEYTERGLPRRAAVTIGPQYGTVDADIIKEAAKEALRGAGFDLLVVCGFAFDAHASEAAREFQPDKSEAEQPDLFVAEEQKQFGRLPILLARMNPDLAMGDELLKKTGAGNLFTVFGEPDLKIDHLADGKLTVEIKGVDVYDPTTGVVRSSSTDDIACWFIDTNYNAESFFVRHAYFTGAGDPYEKLKRALRADVDEAAWSQLYSTRSYPFDPPSTGQIAVKVINHYGDEVLKVYDIR